MKSKRLTFTCDNIMIAQIKRLAANKHLSNADIIRSSILEYIKKENTKEEN